MNDISLIGHMSGQGEAVADKLRQAGYNTLQKIIEEKPSVLAESTGLEPGVISKIIASAKSLGPVRPAAKTKAKTKKKAKKKVSKKAAAPAKKKTVKAKRKTTNAVPKKKVEKPKVTAKRKVAKKAKKSPPRTKKVIAAKPAAKYEITKGTAMRFVNLAGKTPSLKEKILKEIMARDEFRERLARRLVRKLT